MKSKNIIEMLEALAPRRLAESWDNCGVSFGDTDIKVSKVLVALEPTETVINQAIEKNVDMIITHHPMIFGTVKTLSYDKALGRKITKLAKNDIVTYSMHTNMDIAVMGYVAGNKLKLDNVKRLEVTDVSYDSKDNDRDDLTKYGLGSVGCLKDTLSLEQCVHIIKDIFDINKIRVVGDLKSKVKRIAILPGSGKSYINKAIKEEADVLITGDVDYHSAVDAIEAGICLIDAGHFDTERFFVDYIAEYLCEQFKDNACIVEVIKAIEKSPFTIL